MKITLSEDGKNPFVGRTGDLYLDDGHTLKIFTSRPEDVKSFSRLDGQLVLRNGWIEFDQDHDGFIVAIEIHEGDPFAETTLKPLSFIHTKNPLEKQ